MAIQLIVMDEVPFGPTCQAPSHGFVVQYCTEPEVLGNQFLLVWVRVWQLGDSRYL
jgi:hypothetical protein